jgi:hypothetical protein
MDISGCGLEFGEGEEVLWVVMKEKDSFIVG